MQRDITVLVAFALCILGPCLIIATSGHASIGALGRNPSAAPKIFTAMIMMLIFAAAISIVGLLVLFQIYAPKS